MLSDKVRELKRVGVRPLVGSYVHLRLEEMRTKSKTEKARLARREIEIAAALYGRRGGVKALETGLAAARIKS